MTIPITIAIDPLGRAVQLPDELELGGTNEKQPPSIHEEYKRVVEAPSCLIEMPDGRIFYFRSIGWNFTLLLEARFKDGGRVAEGCYKNPSPDYIRTLLQDGIFRAGSSLEALS